MSDLSKPALSLMPKHDGMRPSNAWPTPPFATYPPTRPITSPKDCEVEGPNGKVTQGRLLGIDWEAGIAQVQVPPARGSLPLRFTQFRRLTLLRPLDRPLTADLNSLPGVNRTELCAGIWIF